LINYNTTSVPIILGTSVAVLKMPTRFWFQFDVKVANLGEVEVLNILDVVDIDSLTSLLRIGVKPDLTLSVQFWDAPYVTLTAPLASVTTFTTVIVGYIDNKLSLWTSALSGTVPIVSVGSAETDISSNSFYLYASTAATYATSGGLLRNIVVTRKSFFIS
jgi:hypothetical protein